MTREDDGRRRTRRNEVVQKQKPLETAAFAVSEPLDPTAQELVEQLVRGPVSIATSAYVELPPAFDADGVPRPLADRSHGIPSSEADDRFRYIVAALLRDRRSAERVAERHVQRVGAVIRYFSCLGLHNARAADATALPHISERLLQENDVTAIRYLRAFRDAGADVILVRGTRTRAVAILFLEKLGESVDVFDEAAYVYDRARRHWRRLGTGTEPPSGRGRLHLPVHHRAKRIAHWSLRRIVSFLAWELLFAAVASAAIGPILRLFGTEVVVPIWILALITLPLGWIAGAPLYRAVRPFRDFVSDFVFVVREFPALLRQFREESAYVRRLMTKRADDEVSEDHLDADPW